MMPSSEGSGSMASLADLPVELVLDVGGYLRPKDFLSLAATTKHFWEAGVAQDERYWRILVRSTFRIPDQPMLEGADWKNLYRSLATQSSVYTWGSNPKGQLGHAALPGQRINRAPLRSTGLPEEMANLEKVGVVGDVQCGGWCTVLLNAHGELYAVGAMNGETREVPHRELIRLTFPSAYPPSTKDRYEPSTAISQYSVGRSRVLALSDDGKIWLFTDFHRPAKIVRFTEISTSIRGPKADGRVTKVLAGWNTVSAYIRGVGIVYWKEGEEIAEEPLWDRDGISVGYNVVPETSYLSSFNRRESQKSIETTVGEVTNWTLLEDVLIFITNLHKIFVWHLNDSLALAVAPDELTPLYAHIDEGHIKDIQGTFRHFAIFTNSGAVLVCDTGIHLPSYNQCIIDKSDPSLTVAPIRPIPLQNASVISLAFGDHHYHGLHIDGTVSSYGREPQGCGALGLGTSMVSILRGVYHRTGWAGHDGDLLIPAWSDRKRTVWFEPEKHVFLTETCQKAATPEAQHRAPSFTHDTEHITVYGEWFERKGRNWASGFNGDEHDENDDGIEAYRAIKISAAGWHSGALVLVDQKKADRIRDKYIRSHASAPPLNTSVAATPITPATPSTSSEYQGPIDTDVIASETHAGGAPPAQSGTSNISLRASFSRLNLRLAALRAIARRAADRASERVSALTRHAVHNPRSLFPLPFRSPFSWTQNNPRTSSVEPEPATSDRDSTSDRDVYVWDDLPFPRLRMPDGSEMPGTVAISEYKGGEPDYGWRPAGFVESEEE